MYSPPETTAGFSWDEEVIYRNDHAWVTVRPYADFNNSIGFVKYVHWFDGDEDMQAHVMGSTDERKCLAHAISLAKIIGEAMSTDDNEEAGR